MKQTFEKMSLQMFFQEMLKYENIHSYSGCFSFRFATQLISAYSVTVRQQFFLFFVFYFDRFGSIEIN